MYYMLQRTCTQSSINTDMLILKMYPKWSYGHSLYCVFCRKTFCLL